MSRYVKIALYPALLVALFVAIAVGMRAPESHAHFEPDSSLMVSTRDHLRVCVAGHGAVDMDAVSRQLSGSLGIARQHAQWGAAKYGAGVPAVERACPTTLPDGALTRGVAIGPGLTDAPSPYRAVVLVLDDANADRYLGDRPAALLSYELMKVSDHVAVTVTQAVAVRADFIDRPTFATDYLMPALGLDPTLR